MKNDDMDELFRKAAENYSVDTTHAYDWDRVDAALKQGGNTNGPEINKEKKKKRRGLFIWWLLLLPAGWIAHNSWQTGKQNTLSAQSTAVHLKKVLQEHTNGKGKPKQEFTSPATDAASSSLKEAGNNESAEVPLVGDDESPPSLNEKTVVDAKTVKESVDEKILLQPGGRGSDILNRVQPGGKGNTAELPDKDGHFVKKNANKNKALSHLPAKDAQEDLTEGGPIFNPKNEAKTIVPFMQQVGRTDQTVFPAFAQQKLVSFKDRADKLPGDSSTSSSLKKQTTTRERGFYLQALVAADITTVKFQKVKELGHSAGLLVGYQFNKRWHVEAGALWEKKKYYTAGEHFDTSGLGYLAHYKIYTVNGYCNMITIPLSARYNLSVSERNKWFVTGGVAAYFMDKENYDIKYDYYGQERERNYSYYDAPKSWLATIKLSAGYEHNFWKTFNFRVEPYIRIPAAGVGTGKLSLQSTGVFLGIGKKF